MAGDDRSAALFLVAGFWLAQQQAELPALPVLWGLSVVAVLLLWLTALRPAGTVSDIARLAAVALAAFSWAGISGDAQLAQRLAPALEGRDIDVVGVIASLPQRLDRGQRFEFDVEQAPPGVPPRIALTWPDGSRRPRCVGA
jgi:competence protein ComEC